jgi:hypothetical protein
MKKQVNVESTQEPVRTSTPTPWRIGDAGHTVFGPPNGNPSPTMVAQSVRKEDAQLIIRAVNAHEELVELVKGLRSFFEEGSHEAKVIDQAIAKAEGVKSKMKAEGR